MSNIIDSLEWRYAVKKFNTSKSISNENIEKLKHAFNLTATSYGLQPIKMVVVANKEIQKNLVSYSFNQQQVGQASHVFVLCVEKSKMKKAVISYFNKVQDVRGTSDEIIAPYKKMMLTSFENKTEEEIFIWSKHQAYIALGNLMTVCAMEKIDSCPMEGFIPQGYKDVLGLEALNLEPVLVLPIGIRAEDDMFADFKKVRKEVSESVIDIK
ncbi:nitroreductase [Maribacter vaceletii]|uniref:Nitroreductase n=1 Tax=Maribacter vaceletii TaxID=1206816 RepID=A0A495EBI1_9FLAO|nr:NAD(P)H-dependent oxidoreductase [Maribacter vaceletii]RKR13257.1 nitroreductase [Maribacter vaceletii]